jgi:cell division protein FtsW
MQVSWTKDNQKLLVYVVVTLLALGVIMIYSSTAFSLSHDPSYKLRKQVIWVVIATVCMILAWHTDYRFYARHRRFILGAAIALLLCVYMPGVSREINGAHRWLRIGGFSFQPSEFAKLALIIYVSATLCEMGDKSRRFLQGFLPLAATIGFVSLLILVEPDFGTGIFVAFIGVTLMFVGGVRIFHIAAFGTAILVPLLAVVALKFEHIRSRFSVFLDADADPLGRGYQIKQSLIAIGSGGLFGVGLGESRQKLMFLPERDTDFIYSIVGEELGFVGAAAVLLLFMLFLRCGMKIANRCRDSYSYLLALGLTLSISLQAVLNVAVVTASVPPKGIALPFLSFGGSSLVATMVAVGILLNIAKHNQLPSGGEGAGEGDEDV